MVAYVKSLYAVVTAVYRSGSTGTAMFNFAVAKSASAFASFNFASSNAIVAAETVVH